MRVKSIVFSVTAALALVACGNTPSSPEQPQAYEQQAADAAKAWLRQRAQPDVRSASVGAGSQALAAQHLRLQQVYTASGHKPESYLYLHQDVSLSQITVQNDITTATVTMKELKGPDASHIEEGGNYTFKFTFRRTPTGLLVEDVEEQVTSDDYVSIQERAERLDNPATVALIQQGFHQDKTTNLTAQRLGYDGVAARNYARTYALNYNTVYRVEGNDCTSFASQALREGGWVQKGWAFYDRERDDLWFYQNPWSYTWGGAANWPRFAAYTGRTRKVANISGLGLGDIVQVDKDANGTMDHTAVVTQTPLTSTEYKLSYHSVDRLDISWSSFVSGFASNAVYSFHDVLYSDE